VLQFSSRMDELEELLSDNRVWKERTVGIGLINAQQAWDWGCRCGRGCGGISRSLCCRHVVQHVACNV
jgi:NADH:ubiquinone oxidoreductase subunit D